MDAELPARRGHQPQEQSGRYHQLRALRAGAAPARVRRGEDRRPRSRGPHLHRRHAFRDIGRRGAKTDGRRSDDLLGRASDVHRRSLRRTGFGHRRHDDRRIYRERLFQPRVGAQDCQAFRAEHRFVVPFRARRRSQHAGLCRQARRPADEGAGRGRDFERHYRHLSHSCRRLQIRHLLRPHRLADRQEDSRRYGPHDPRRAGSEDSRRERGCAERRRAALPRGRAARSRPRRGYPPHLWLQQCRDSLARPFDALLCAEARPQQADESRGRFPDLQRLHRDHVQLADQGGLLRGAGVLQARKLRAHPQSAERRPERDAPDAAV